MRIPALLLAVAFSTSAAAHGISDEFFSGFGGVPWGISLPDLIKQFPGGYQVFSTAPSGLAYVLNIDDPVLGFSRRGSYVSYAIGSDLKMDDIEIQIPYEQTAQLIATISKNFGPVIGPEIKGLISRYRWPVDSGMLLRVRTTNDRTYGLTTLSVTKVAPRPAAKPKTK